MTQIVQGDQYIIPIKIIKGSSPLTPADVSDVRIQVGNLLKTYSKNEITFNTDTNEWQYSLSQEQTFDFEGEFVKVQVGVKVENDIVYSIAKSININDNIIVKEW